MKILVIEDREEFRVAAKKYFSSVPDVLVDYAQDYDQAMLKLNEEKYNGTLIDCFFPKKTGSGDISFGVEVCNDLENVLTDFFSSLRIVNKKGEGYIEDASGKYHSVKEYVAPLREALEKAENQQPLGILVANEAEKKDIPFRLVTSENHHGDLTGKICYYQRSKGWKEIIDNEAGEKNTIPFWENAYNDLKEELK